jgi:hypothetical protein
MPPLRGRAPRNPHFSGSPQNLINESIMLIEEREKSFKILRVPDQIQDTHQVCERTYKIQTSTSNSITTNLTSVLLATVVHPTSNVKIHWNISYFQELGLNRQKSTGQ